MIMKFKQIAKFSACTMALAGLLISSGCGKDDVTDPNDKNDPVNTPVPEPGTDGPPDTK